MKLNLEIDIDYIDEEGNLDSTIKTEIINRISSKVEQKIEDRLNSLVLDAAKKKADAVINQIIKNFMDRKFTMKDKWGDEIKTDVTVKKLLKEKFDEFWNTQVDDRGRSEGYGRNRRRIEWVIDQQIEQHSHRFAERLTKDTENKIKTMMKENLQKSIGAKLVSELGFDKLLLESKNG